MELTQLKYFKAVAEAGKLAKASEQLYVSVSALSSSVSQLEKELGVALFDREGNRLTLNRQGKLRTGRYVHHGTQPNGGLSGRQPRSDLRQPPSLARISLLAVRAFFKSRRNRFPGLYASLF